MLTAKKIRFLSAFGWMRQPPAVIASVARQSMAHECMDCHVADAPFHE
jgi:hypothetical protein